MGLHFSRLALAVALSLQLTAPLYAAEQLDEFYIEIKGPDKAAVSPLVPASPQPLATPVQSTPIQPKPVVKPSVRKSTLKAGVPQPFLATEEAVAVDDSVSAGVYGPVKSSDTLWSIAQRVRPSGQVSINQTLLAIYRKNPQAFAGGRLSGLYKGARLSLPTLAQIQSESEAQAQQVLRQGGMTLPARSNKAPARVIKLSPTAETTAQVAETAAPAVKPVVKLTPEKPGITASESAPTPPTATTVEAVSAAQPAAPAAQPAPATEEVVSNKVVIQGTPEAPAASSATSTATGVDASVTALVAQTSSAAQATQADPAWQAEYKGKFEELSKANGQLESQVSQLTQDVAQLKALLEQKVVASVTPATSAATVTEAVPPADAEPGFWSQLVATPLNLALLLLLPFLLALALVSLWWMARAKRDQAARELDDAESTDLLMAEGDSHFDHLLAADMVAITDLPDLDQQDETLQPRPEIVQDERKEPAFTIPNSFSLNESAKGNAQSNPELIPEFGTEPVIDDLGLDEDLDLDLSVQPDEPQWGAASEDALDESEFLSELGINQTETQPLPAETISSTEAPEALEPIAATEEEFVPRENLNISNDELDALFSSMDELENDPSFVNLEGSDESENEIEILENEALSASEDEINLKNSLASLNPQANDDPAEIPAADWYNEADAADLNAPVDMDDIDALLAQSAPAAKPPFKDIDELLAEADLPDDNEEPYAGLSLDVGLDEFPEVLPEGDSVDVDAEGELGAKLDLARAYLEIDDKSSAIELLNEVIASGSNQQKDEAQRLLKRLA
jgi:pilus assembly protein FimV